MNRKLLYSTFLYLEILATSNVIFSSEVNINDNITAEAYSNGIMLNCSFDIRNGDAFGSIVLAAENLTTGKFQDIAGSFGDENPLITSFGINVFGNKTNVLIVEKSENSLLITFNNVMCKHERQYKCYLGVRQIDSFTPKRIESDIMSIHVKVPPSKPDNISLVSMQMTSTPVIYDGDNITYVCSGNVGKPSENFNFEMYHRENILFKNYTSTETSTEALAETCSYYRKSYITIHVTAKDNQAIIRCVVSNSENMDLYADSEPLEVYYAVRKPTIDKYPNKTEYVVGSDASINLTCSTDGNPKPNYAWYKQSSLQAIGTGEFFFITNLNETYGGVYTCSVSNTVKEVIHKDRVQVHVNIKDNAPAVEEKASSRNSFNVINIWIICGSILFVLCVITFCVVQQHRKKYLRCLTNTKNERSVGNVQTTQQDNSSFYEGVEHTLDLHNYDQLSRSQHLYTNFNL